MSFKNKKILAVIPARGGSKGIPRKNIKLLAGKPLIAYTIEAALKSKYLDRVIVSTEDEEIAEISKKYGAEVIKRPKRLAKDNVPVIPDIPRHIIKELEKREKYIPEIVVILQPTSPLRGTKYIDLSIEKLIKTKCDWVVTVSKVNQHPYRMRIMKGDKLVPLFKNKNIWAQRQDLPTVYLLNGAVYATWREILKTKNVFFMKDWRGVVMKEKEGIDIDTPFDFLIVKILFKLTKNLNKYNED